MPTIRGKGPRDGFPDHIVKFLKRLSSGKLVGLCERHFPVGPKEQRIDVAWLNRRLAPDPGWDIPCIDCNAIPTGDGIVVVAYNYEGIEANFEFTEDEVTYELDSSMEDEPIETHPGIQKLIERWGYDTQTHQFPEFEDPGAAGSGVNGGSTKQKRHPLFGVESWKTVGVIFRVTYDCRIVPARAYRGWGTLISKPTGIEKLNMPAQPRRPWLRLPSNIVRKGNVCTVTEEAMLGKPGGVKAAQILYSAAQLETASSGGTSGLSSGGLTTGSL